MALHNHLLKRIQESNSSRRVRVVIEVENHDSPESVVEFFRFMESKTNSGASREWGCLDEQSQDHKTLSLDGDGPVRMKVISTSLDD